MATMSTKKLSILIVEDVNLVQKMAGLALKQTDCRIDKALSGKQAMQQINDNQYDLIFMDLGLPDTDGFKLTQYIRQLSDPQKKNTPVIALTAHGKEDYKKHALNAGMNDFLVKPLTNSAVMSIINKYIRKQ